MNYTIDETTGNLKITVTVSELNELCQNRRDLGEDAFGTNDVMHQEFASLIENTDLEWIRPEEIGALTDAPILGIYGDEVECDGPDDPRRLVGTWEVNGKLTTFVSPVEKAWAFMDYCLTSPQERLADLGYVYFTGGD